MLPIVALSIALAITPDPLVQTLARLNHDADPAVKKDVQPRLDAASKALAEGRRMLAIYQTATVLPLIEGAKFANARPVAERNSETSFEKTWKGDSELRATQKLPAIEPALLRAFAEGAILRKRNFYNASLDYARSTTAEAGYLGQSHGQRALLAFLQPLSTRQESPA